MKDVKTIVKGVLTDFFDVEPVDKNDHSFLGVVIDDEDKELLATAIEEALEKVK